MSDVVDILPHLLLPLAGPEEFPEDDMEKLPPDLQYLDENKQRETDPVIRRMLLDALLQVSGFALNCQITVSVSFTNLRTFGRKTSRTQIFFILLKQSGNELPLSKMQKKWEVTDLVFEIKWVENYFNFDKSVLVTRHGLTGR